MKLTDCSDFDLNQLVCQRLGLTRELKILTGWIDEGKYLPIPQEESVDINDATYFDLFPDQTQTHVECDAIQFNPCTQWAHAGPLAAKFRVSLNYRPVDDIWMADRVEGKYEWQDRNPCRAICLAVVDELDVDLEKGVGILTPHSI